MITIRKYYHLHEIYIDKATLELEGIDSFVINEPSFTVMADAQNQGVLLQVADSDAEKAVAILTLREEEE